MRPRDEGRDHQRDRVPGAVLELSKEFRFANIGGTSAGAIAAALTAAAEFGRQHGGGSAGFDRVAELPATSRVAEA